MKNFFSVIFKHTRSGKLDVEYASHIEGCVKPNIQEKYNHIPKIPPEYYSDMLLPLTKNMHGKK